MATRVTANHRRERVKLKVNVRRLVGDTQPVSCTRTCVFVLCRHRKRSECRPAVRPAQGGRRPPDLAARLCVWRVATRMFCPGHLSLLAGTPVRHMRHPSYSDDVHSPAGRVSVQCYNQQPGPGRPTACYRAAVSDAAGACPMLAPALLCSLACRLGQSEQGAHLTVAHNYNGMYWTCILAWGRCWLATQCALVCCSSALLGASRLLPGTDSR